MSHYSEEESLREHAENLRIAKTEIRRIDASPHVAGIGFRRCQLVHNPAFEAGYAWEICEMPNDGWYLYRSVLQEDAESVVGFDRIICDSELLAGFFSQLCASNLSLTPELSGMIGLDGESYEIAICGDMFSSIRVKWWGGPPEQWEDLANVVHKMLREFKSFKVDPNY